jgi:3-methyladenine DNA glycosylase Tag
VEKFSSIFDTACERKGGKAALMRLLPKPLGAKALQQVGNDRCLAQMTRCIFQAGFVWRVVDNKWDNFEEVFFGFPPEKIVMLSPEQIDRFSQDQRIIRNRQKVLSVQHNAHYILDVSKSHGSFSRFIQQWPSSDLIGLFAHMKKQGSRLGGMTGQRVLRNLGRDTFILTGDVVRCLQRSGLDIAEGPTSKRELGLAQQAFNLWHEESGLSYSQLSRVCAMSV